MLAGATGQEDADGNLILATACDVCGRSEDQLDQPWPARQRLYLGRRTSNPSVRLLTI
jgi:hypothetical protein